MTAMAHLICASCNKVINYFEAKRCDCGALLCPTCGGRVGTETYGVSKGKGPQGKSAFDEDTATIEREEAIARQFGVYQ